MDIYMNDLRFLMEMLCSPEEAGFLRQLWEKPQDENLRLVYADWLDEQRRPAAAEAARKGYVPGYGIRVGSISSSSC